MKGSNIFKNRLAVPALALLCTLLWGSAPPVIKYGYSDTVFAVTSSDTASQILFAGIRFLFAGIMLLIFGFVSSGKKSLPQKKDIKPILLLAVTQTTLHYLFTFVGLAHTTATKGGIFTASSGFISVLLAPLFFKKEKLTAWAVAGSIIGFSGIICINFDSSEFGGFAFMGEGFILLAAICYVAGNFISKSAAASRSASMLNGYQMLIGSLVLIIAGYASGGRLSFANYRCWFVVIYLAAVSAVSFTLWTLLLVNNSAGRICIYNLLIPVFSAAISGILLHENIFTPINLISLSLVCGGIALVNLKSGKKPPTLSA